MPSVSSPSLLDSWAKGLRRSKGMVVGDVILDAYMTGKMQRISPEAPVPVVDITDRKMCLGGAANVALNLQGLGAEVILCSLIGDDPLGKTLCSIAQDAGLDTSGLIADPTRKTTCKTRILASNQHILRVDEEINDPLNEIQISTLQAVIDAKLPDCEWLIFQDYDKGVLTERLITHTMATARRLHIPTTVDPKRRQFFAYRGAQLFKPNLKEFEESMRFVWQKGDFETLRQQAARLRKEMDIEEVLVTLSEEGMYAQNAHEEWHEPTRPRQIIDVSGAGDAVISVATLCKVYGLDMPQTLALANLAGGLVCEASGVVPITVEALAKHATKLPLFTHNK